MNIKYNVIYNNYKIRFAVNGGPEQTEEFTAESPEQAANSVAAKYGNKIEILEVSEIGKN